MEGTQTFLDYFKHQWVERNFGWYEGYAPEIPSTNNGLESFNRYVKGEHTFGVRMGVGQFLELIKNNLVKSWSTDRDPNNVNAKVFSGEPTISLEEYTKGYQWIQQKKKVLMKKNRQLTLHFTPAKSTEQITTSSIDQFMSVHENLQWQTFDEFVTNESEMWCIKLNRENWSQSKCSCHYFSKNIKCKHIIGIAARERIENCIIPLAAKSIPLGQKRKRGAPTKNKPALIVQ